MSLKGKNFLLKQGDGADPEVFDEVARQRATSFSVNGEEIDVSSKDSDGWRELMGDENEGGGLASISVNVEGIVAADGDHDAIRDAAMSGAIKNYQLDDSEDILEGPFQVTNYEQSGDHDGAQEYSATLESAGEVTAE